MELSADQLLEIFPRCPREKAEEYARAFNAACLAHPWTINRLSCFLGQLSVESGDLRYWEELADGSAYEGRKDLGNTEPGDGPRFKGRGPIQITGRANYQAFAEWHLATLSESFDLGGFAKELAKSPLLGFLSAIWYWESRGLDALADLVHVPGITRKINGGLTHLEQRKRATARALKVLCKVVVLT